MQILDASPTPLGASRTTRLGDLLVAGGIITAEQLEKALNYQRSKGGRLGICLIKLGFLTEDILHSVLTRQFGVSLIDLSSTEIEPEIVKLLPRDYVVRYQVIPVRKNGSVLSVALNDPNDVLVMDDLRFRTGCRIEALLARESQIREAIDKYYGSHKEVELQKVFEDMPKAEADDAENLQLLAEEDVSMDPE